MKKTAVTILAIVSMGIAQAQSGVPAHAYGYVLPMPRPVMPEIIKDSPAALLEEGMGRLLELLRRVDLNPRSLGQYMDVEIAPYFDFSYMAKSAAGNMYRHMSSDQRLRMAERIKHHLLSTMVRKLDSYNN